MLNMGIRNQWVGSHYQWFRNSLIEQFLLCEFIHVISKSNNHSHFFNHQMFEYETVGHFVVDISANADAHQLQVIQIHKLNVRRCALVLIQVDREFSDSQMPTKLFNTLTPRNLPIIRKDEDYFVFLCTETTERICEQLSMSEGFGNKVKNKITLVEGESKVKVKTINLYGAAGEPSIEERIIPLPIKDYSFLKLPELFPDYSKSFNGKVFRISYPKAPFYIEVERRNGFYLPKRGLYSIWLIEMSQKMNFSYVLFPASFGGSSGKKLANGTWKGAVADVLYGAADMAALVAHVPDRDGGAALSLLSSSKSKTYRLLFSKVSAYPDPAECLRQTLLADMGCIIWKSVSDHPIAKNFTDKNGNIPFQRSSHTTSLITDGYIWEKRAVFRQPLDYITSSMMEIGLTEFWYKKDLDHVRKQSQQDGQKIIYNYDNDDGGAKKLILNQLKGVFLVAICGLGVAGMVFIYEIGTQGFLMKMPRKFMIAGKIL
ncbi:unnamed protein product [Orchesella dallaii]|uniref:Uncharacterized protein n=1 Tax=Orchesella dallaii TaxID=48710 RepID=A0ABP1PTT9_9HEXA